MRCVAVLITPILVSFLHLACGRSSGFGGGIGRSISSASTTNPQAAGDAANTSSYANMTFDQLQPVSTADFFNEAIRNASNDGIEYEGHTFYNLADFLIQKEYVFTQLASNYPTMEEYLESIGVIAPDSVSPEDVEAGLDALEIYFSRGNFEDEPGGGGDGAATRDLLSLKSSSSAKLGLAGESAHLVDSDVTAPAAAGIVSGNSLVAHGAAAHARQLQSDPIPIPQPSPGPDGDESQWWVPHDGNVDPQIGPIPR